MGIDCEGDIPHVESFPVWKKQIGEPYGNGFRFRMNFGQDKFVRWDELDEYHDMAIEKYAGPNWRIWLRQQPRKGLYFCCVESTTLTAQALQRAWEKENTHSFSDVAAALERVYEAVYKDCEGL